LEYSLKDKIEVTEEFINDIISKNWQEAESIQQQITNIDTSTELGAEVVKLLKNMSTSYYVLIGCLETLVENPNTKFELSEQSVDTPPTIEKEPELEVATEYPNVTDELEVSHVTNLEANIDFEPFEYFVDFDEPSGEPITDKDLYN
jgi:hypothetical protein